MSEGLIVLDDELRILSANSAAVRLMGAETRDWSGENLIVFSRDTTLSQKARAAVRGGKESLACENKEGAHLHLSLSPVDVEGAPRGCVLLIVDVSEARAAVRGGKESLACENKEGAHLHLSLSPVDVEGAPRGCVLLIVDVSERYAAERSRREFTANVSHELKTPLTSISGYAEMVSLGLAKPDDVRGFAQKIHDEAGRLIALVDDIMKLSHLDESTPASLPG